MLLKNHMKQRILLFFVCSFLGYALAGLSQISGNVDLVEGKKGPPRGVSKDMLVYVDSVSAPIPESVKARPVVMQSENKAFAPRIEVVPVGGSVRFPNVDNIMHNVFSLSRSNRFDLGLYKSGAFKEFTFEKPGLVRVYCNIHPQMSAFIRVVDNPYFAWTKPDGSFEIPGVPPGQYQLRVWNERGEVGQAVVVREGGAHGVRIELDVSKFKTRRHTNKFGKPYRKKRGKY